MKRSLTLSLLSAPVLLFAQELYFPPTTGDTWDSTDPATLGWCTDEMPALREFLQTSNTKAFIVLKDGKIVIEEYFGTFTQDSSWYWASAGKSLTAFLAGMAQQEGLLDVDQPTSTYLGQGWTSCTPEQEAAITVRNQLSMTTGLDDGGTNFDCLDPECLTYLADPGTRWAYHNGPYTLMDGVIENATGQNLNAYVYSRLGNSTGILGLFIQLGANNVFFSKARAMARFGLLAQNRGTWESTPILNDDTWFEAMTTPSQNLNKAYGLLWWLNGQEDFMLPGIQVVFPGPLMPDAPPDTYSAMGKNGQIVNVSPSTGLVVVRMGNLPGDLFVPNVYNNDIWERLNAVICTSTGIGDRAEVRPAAFPNPTTGMIRMHHLANNTTAELISSDGRATQVHVVDGTLDLRSFPAGVYLVRTQDTAGRVTTQRVVLGGPRQ